MILDHFENIDRYRSINDELYQCLKHLVNVTEEVKLGQYKVTNSSKLIVSEYEVTKIGLGKFESHRYVVDIQYPIVGNERIKWSPISGLKVESAYNEDIDTTFYLKQEVTNECIIGDGVFAIFFQEDGHYPQLRPFKENQLIKKLTYKVRF